MNEYVGELSFLLTIGVCAASVARMRQALVYRQPPMQDLSPLPRRWHRGTLRTAPILQSPSLLQTGSLH